MNGASSGKKNKRGPISTDDPLHDPDRPLTATQISKPRRTAHEPYDDNDEDDKRRAHRSKASVRQARKLAAGKSTTNREKARRKNVLMTLGKARGKSKRSLTEKSRVLRQHAERAKRGGKRGNR